MILKLLIGYLIFIAICAVSSLLYYGPKKHRNCYVPENCNSKYCCTGDGCPDQDTCRLYKNYINDN